jgi:hypothetical protein
VKPTSGGAYGELILTTLLDFINFLLAISFYIKSNDRRLPKLLLPGTPQMARVKAHAHRRGRKL